MDPLNPIETTLRDPNIISQILASGKYPMRIVDKDFRIVYANNAYCLMNQTNSTKIVGHFCQKYDYCNDCSTEKCSITMMQSILDDYHQTNQTNSRILDQQTYQNLIFEKNIEIPDGYSDKRSYILRIAPLINIDNKLMGIIQTYIDVTEQKQIQQNLTHAKNKADQANRLKSEFLANMSHEIRTPMNGILGMLELLQFTELSENQKEYVSDIQGSAKHLLSIINDILDYSKIEASKMKMESIPTHLPILLKDVINLIAAKAHQKGLELIILTDPLLPEIVLTDPLRLRQILINLLSNAIKFTEQGEVILEVIALTMDKNQCVINFSIKDTGIGIQENHLKDLFQAFSQLDTSVTRKFGGTGLGLSITKNLVHLLGGTLQVSSTVGKGSIFYFDLTMRQNHPKPRTNDQPENEPKNQSLLGKNIALCVPNRTYRNILQDFLEQKEGKVFLSLRRYPYRCPFR